MSQIKEAKKVQNLILGKMKTKKCPICGKKKSWITSNDIAIITSMSWNTPVESKIPQTVFICGNCGYTITFTPVIHC